ncbi:MAG: hypothetical protein GTN89_15130 [Acidobacteria bacterium]|nr:hypothetical protein [Acidobacteriota bacterium]NIM61542.1 hypothetical protein [Acidobacteriota bacterium]NIO60553.1 hypothetical protein [Acidobacteriota bacterium]NIQ31660.1 hypothetical protein [Acidobacteriota bacterium]NIQ86899.1 hypothetical protein [Acidobacteriota bacterium]
MASRAKRVLLGCLAGCGFVLLLFVGSCIGLTVWLNQPGEVLEPRVLLGPETTGYIEWTLRLEDPGTAEFTEGMLQRFAEISEQSDSPLPDGLESLLNARQMRSARKDMNKLFPIVVAWTTHPAGRPDDGEHVFTASASGLGHRIALMDWIFGLILRWRGGADSVNHEGERIYLMRESSETRAAAFVRNGIVFVTTDLDSAKQALARLGQPATGAAGATEFGVLFDSVPKDQPLQGALTNRGGELRRVLDALDLETEHVSDESWDEVRGATIIAGFRNETDFGGTVTLLGPGSDWAEAHAGTLGPALETLFERSRIDFVTTVRRVGDRIEVDFTTQDLFGQIESMN